MKKFFGFFLFLLIAAVVISYFSFYIVHQTQQAMVLEFGKIKKVVTEPGLYWKIPVIQDVEYFDKRILEIDAQPQEVIAVDKKRLVVDAFARYRIIDPLLFFQSVRNEQIARSRLSSLLESSVRRVLGGATFEALVRNKREELMRQIRTQVNGEAKDFGIRIVDVRIKRADLPEANSQAIYRRMQTERQQEAAQTRAVGEEQSRRIRSDADRQVTILKADAAREGEKIRGDGDAKRASIFAEAFNRDADFFTFYRSMQAYEAGLKSGDTRLILSPDSDFFRYFKDPSGSVNNKK